MGFFAIIATRGDTLKSSIASHGQCIVRINRNRSLDQLLYKSRSAKIAARRATISLSRIATSSTVLFGNVANKPFVARRRSVSAISSVKKSKAGPSGMQKSAVNRPSVVNNVIPAKPSHMSQNIVGSHRLTVATSEKNGNGDDSNDKGLMAKSSSESGGSSKAENAAANVNESGAPNIVIDSDTNDSMEIDVANTTTTDVIENGAPSDAIESNAGDSVGMDVDNTTDANENDASNTAIDSNANDSLQEMHSDSGDNSTAIDVVANKENVEPSNMSVTTDECPLFPFLPPVMQATTCANIATTILDNNVPNMLYLSAPIAPIASTFSPVGDEIDLISLDDIIDSSVPILPDSQAPIAPEQPKPKRAIPGLIPICDLPSSSKKQYGPARRKSNTFQFILGTLDKYEEQKNQTVPLKNISIDEKKSMEDSGENFGQLIYDTDSDLVPEASDSVCDSE